MREHPLSQVPEFVAIIAPPVHREQSPLQNSPPYTGLTDRAVSYLPTALKATAQWVLWRGTPEHTAQGTRIKKPPYTIHLTLADVTCPRDWSTLARCLDALPVALEEWQADPSQPYCGGGIGFAVSASDPFCGIDLDHCVDLTTGGMAPWATRVLRDLNSYAEVSPSGTGMHVFVRGSLTGLSGNKRNPVEIYDRLRYFTITGRHIPSTPRTIETRQTQLTAFHRRVFPPSIPATGTPPPVTPGPQTDDAVFESASRRYGSRFHALWAGTHFLRRRKPNEPPELDYSADDYELVSMLARCTSDCAQVERLFRHSGLMRDKWDRRTGQTTYGQRTIRRAYERLQGHTQRCPTEKETVGHQSDDDRQERTMLHIAMDSTPKG